MFGKKKESLKPLMILQDDGKSPAEKESIRIARANYTKLANEIRQRAEVFDSLAQNAPLCMSKREIELLQKASSTILKAINSLFIQRVK